MIALLIFVYIVGVVVTANVFAYRERREMDVAWCLINGVIWPFLLVFSGIGWVCRYTLLAPANYLRRRNRAL